MAISGIWDQSVGNYSGRSRTSVDLTGFVGPYSGLNYKDRRVVGYGLIGI